MLKAAAHWAISHVQGETPTQRSVATHLTVACSSLLLYADEALVKYSVRLDRGVLHCKPLPGTANQPSDGNRLKLTTPPIVLALGATQPQQYHLRSTQMSAVPYRDRKKKIERVYNGIPASCAACRLHIQRLWPSIHHAPSKTTLQTGDPRKIVAAHLKTYV